MEDPGSLAAGGLAAAKEAGAWAAGGGAPALAGAGAGPAGGEDAKAPGDAPARGRAQGRARGTARDGRRGPSRRDRLRRGRPLRQRMRRRQRCRVREPGQPLRHRGHGMRGYRVVGQAIPARIGPDGEHEPEQHHRARRHAAVRHRRGESQLGLGVDFRHLGPKATADIVRLKAERHRVGPEEAERVRVPGKVRDPPVLDRLEIGGADPQARGQLLEVPAAMLARGTQLRPHPRRVPPRGRVVARGGGHAGMPLRQPGLALVQHGSGLRGRSVTNRQPSGVSRR